VIRRRLIFFAALMAVFAGSIVAWTGTSLNLELDIAPYNPGGQEGNEGKLVTGFTAIGETFSIIQGKAQKIAGIELYEIVLAEVDVCADVRIHLTLLNPYDMGKALNNPHSFIDVGVWYPVKPTDAQESVELDHNGQTVWRDDGAKASAMMSQVFGNVVLHPSKTVTSTLYILASIMVPGGAPPGQQEELTDLRFQCLIEK